MFAVFDIGGTHIRIGVAKTLEKIDDTVIVHTPQSFEEGIVILIEQIKKLAGNEKVTAIAGGIAGPLNMQKTMVTSAPNLPLWNNKPLSEKLSNAFNCQVMLENDAALGGLGEAVFGAGKGEAIIAYIAVGTGVGGALIINGAIATSSHGFEPGHQIIIQNGQEDACGKFGHLEAYIGGKYIKEKKGKAPEEIKDKAFWDEVAHYLSVGLNNTIVHWSPDIVVVAGSVGEHILLGKVTEDVNSLLHVFPVKPKIVAESLGKLSGLYGGIALLVSKQ